MKATARGIFICLTIVGIALACKKKEDNSTDTLIGDILLYRALNPTFVFSCDFIVGSGLCLNINSNAGPYNCTGQNGTVSSSPCPCNGAVVGSCRRSTGSIIYYSNVYTQSTATTHCTTQGVGTFTTTCLTQ